MSKKQRTWNDNELTIAYYIAKYDFNGLKMDEDFIVDNVIGNTTLPSLKMQVANFRALLELDGPKLEDYSVAMEKLAKVLNNKTVTQIRKMIWDYCDTIEDLVSSRQVESANQIANKKKDELNAELEKNFQAKLSLMKRMGRTLTKVNK